MAELAEVKVRGFTGKVDRVGHHIYEGDIIEEKYNDIFGRVLGIVHWDVEKAAFCMRGQFVAPRSFSEGQGAFRGGWHSFNLEGTEVDGVRLASWYDNPELLVRARKMSESGPSEVWDPEEMLLGEKS